MQSAFENMNANYSNPFLRIAGARGGTPLMLCAALLFSGCGKPAPKAPEKSLVRTAIVESADNLRADGEASYLASVKFDQETDLSFKVGGILTGIGPNAEKDW